MRTHGIPNVWNVQISIKWKYSVESHIIARLWVFEEIRSYYQTQIINMSMGNAKSHTVGILWERLIYSHTYSLTLPSHIKDNP